MKNQKSKTQIKDLKIKIIKFQSKYAKEVSEITREVVKEFVARDFTNESALKRYFDFHDVKKNQKDFITRRLSEICYVALIDDKVVGTIWGSKDKLSNFFVHGEYHGKGIGKVLLDTFEKQLRKFGSKEVKVFSSSYAVEVYKRYGFKKTTGIRTRHGIKGQPMKKVLK